MSKLQLIGLLIAVTFLAYFSSLGNPFMWDDEQFIQKNVYVQNFDLAKIFTTNTIAGAGIQSNYYRPITSLTFAIDAKIWGTNTFGFHIANLVVHIATGVLLFLLLMELGIGKWAAGAISLFFLVDPLQTEAVVYINSRGDSLYACFLVASLLVFAKGLHKNFTFKKTVAVSLLFLASILSKETALAGVALFPLIGIVKKGWRGFRNPALSRVLIVLVVVTLLYFLLRLSVLNFSNTLNFYNADNEYTKSLAIRLFTFCKVLWIYLGLIVWPYPLHMERTVTLVRTVFSPWVLSIIGFIGGVIGIGAWQFQRKNPWILFGFGWFFSMLLPTSGIIPINGILYEHWLYVPLVGFFIVLYGVYKMVPKNAWVRNTLISFVVFLGILYMFLTVRQNNIWSDPITFYTYTLSFTPQSARLHNNLGISYADKGKIDDAIKEYEKALQFGYPYPQIYNNLGNTYAAIGKYDKAEVNFKKALELAPQFEIAKLNLIKLYLVTKQYDKARDLSQNNPSVLQLIEKLQKE